MITAGARVGQEVDVEVGQRVDEHASRRGLDRHVMRDGDDDASGGLGRGDAGRRILDRHAAGRVTPSRGIAVR